MYDYGSPIQHYQLSRLTNQNALRISFVDGAPLTTFTQALPGMKTTIQPRFDPDIHEWLTGLGGDQHESFFDWLAAVWDLSRPATMLHIQGATDSGKSLIIKGLRACTERNMTATISDMFGEFQDQALNTPLLVGDEEYGTAGKSARSIVNVLKKLATGEANMINAKGKAAVQIQGYWRVIMVENGTRMLQFKEDMSASDERALLTRLLCVVADNDKCRAVLDRIGGAAGVESWLAYKLPQHLRWLGVHRKLSATDRVLAMSRSEHKQTSLLLGTSTMDKLISTLGNMLENVSKYGSLYWIKKRCLIVTTESISASMMEITKATESQMASQQSIKEALRTLSGQLRPKSVRVKESARTSVKTAWSIPLPGLIERLVYAGEQYIDFRAGRWAMSCGSNWCPRTFGRSTTRRRSCRLAGEWCWSRPPAAGPSARACATPRRCASSTAAPTATTVPTATPTVTRFPHRRRSWRWAPPCSARRACRHRHRTERDAELACTLGAQADGSVLGRAVADVDLLALPLEPGPPLAPVLRSARSPRVIFAAVAGSGDWSTRRPSADSAAGNRAVAGCGGPPAPAG